MSVYYGLPPEEGFTYALYLCPQCGFNFIANRGQEMYCPSCGSVVNFTQEVSASDLPANIREVGKCNACTSPLATSATDAELAGMPAVYCPQCGSAVELNIKTQSQKQQPTAASPFLRFVTPEDLVSKQGPQAPSETQITMTLHRCPDKGPFWNIIIDGNPVARVYLQDQSNPEEIRDFFVSEKYPEVLKQAAAQFGVQEALASVNAKFYAFDEAPIREKVAQELRAEYEKKFHERVLHLREEFKEAVAISLAGINKNIWPDIDNPLKAALYSELVKAGVDKPTRYIEAAFERAADDYFDRILNKAMEIMAKPQEVRAEIKQLVATASVAVPEEEPASPSPLEKMSSQEVKAKLVEGNFAFVPPSGRGSASTGFQSVSDWKAAFKAVIRRR